MAPHMAWNPGPDTARVRMTFRPALCWEEAVDRMFADPQGVRALP